MFGSRHARTILAILATSTRPLHRDALTAILWPGDPSSIARPRLRTEMHRLREALREASGILVFAGDAVKIDRKKVVSDLDQLTRLLTMAPEGGDAEDRLRLLREAVSLLRGRLLSHETYVWCDANRAHRDNSMRRWEEAGTIMKEVLAGSL